MEHPNENLFTYLRWRGDLCFDAAPLNEADALALPCFPIWTIPKSQTARRCRPQHPLCAGRWSRRAALWSGGWSF